MSSIHHPQWCVGRMHRYAAKGCSWVMIHSMSFAVPGLSHMLDHSWCCLSMHLNGAYRIVYLTMLYFCPNLTGLQNQPFSDPPSHPFIHSSTRIRQVCQTL